MSNLKAFSGIRYNPKKAGDIANLIAPPFDVVGEDERKSLYSRSEFNVARLILPEAQKTDSPRDNKYKRAASQFRQWIESGVMAKDGTPRIYRYMITFEVKTSDGIVQKQRPGFIALLKLHEYEDAVVLPHERTLAGPKEDRFQLMEHARANFSPVFMLYEDPESRIDQILALEPPKGASIQSCEDDHGVTHTVWPIEDKAVIDELEKATSKNVFYIADGHHRYETALAFRRHLREKSPLFAGGADYRMVYFTPVENPGLVVLPYHRILHNLPKRRFGGLIKNLEQYFEVTRALVSPFEPGAPRRDFIKEIEKRGEAGAALGMVDGQKNESYFLTLRPNVDLKKQAENEAGRILADLDVVILEELILTEILGIKREDLLNEKHVSYETDYDQVIDNVHIPPNQLAFLLNPTRVKDVLRVSRAKGVMPEKSTYFFPKLATGMVINDLED